MRFTRALNRLICRVLIGLVLFAQFAVTSHACPTEGYASSHAATHVGAQVVDATADTAGDSDLNSSNLCVAHCTTAQQASDVSPTPAVAQPALGFMLISFDVEIDASCGRTAAAMDPLLKVPSPPHSLLHCVFRT